MFKKNIKQIVVNDPARIVIPAAGDEIKIDGFCDLKGIEVLDTLGSTAAGNAGADGVYVFTIPAGSQLVGEQVKVKLVLDRMGALDATPAKYFSFMSDPITVLDDANNVATKIKTGFEAYVAEYPEDDAAGISVMNVVAGGVLSITAKGVNIIGLAISSETLNMGLDQGAGTIVGKPEFLTGRQLIEDVQHITFDNRDPYRIMIGGSEMIIDPEAFYTELYIKTMMDNAGWAHGVDGGYDLNSSATPGADEYLIYFLTAAPPANLAALVANLGAL